MHKTKEVFYCSKRIIFDSSTYYLLVTGLLAKLGSSSNILNCDHVSDLVSGPVACWVMYPQHTITRSSGNQVFGLGLVTLPWISI